MLYNRHIDTFICVARLGSFSRAADELHLTAAGVGKHIDDLESIIDRKLFDRGKKGVRLTEYGQHFYEECHDMIRLSEEIIERTRFSGANEVKPIRIGYSPLAPMDMFNKIYLSSSELSRFKISVVQYSSNLNTDNGYYAVPEIIFALEEFVTYYSGISFLPLSILKLTCLVPTGHRLVHKQKLTYDDLAGETLYFPSRGNPDLTLRFTNYMRKEHPDITVETPSIFYDLEVINHCVREGSLLIGFDLWKNIHPGLVNIPVEWDWSIPYGALWKKDARKEVLDFMEAFKEALNRS